MDQPGNGAGRGAERMSGSPVAIRVEGLSKQYRLGARKEKYRTLRDVLAANIVAPVRRARSLFAGSNGKPPTERETIWALKDVSFEIKPGEVVGVIGRNGAGKSTLLKILSRITEPTDGHADIYGRVGSLLEVGTGFHPELSGRENIFLNGAILGMRRAEIERQFDEIVAFAEVEKFIDSAVKHYSSGMYLRLAFAVAAHMDPEILMVDEVLAVGDAAFQKKCIGKMGEIAGQGRTVFFVSHNLGAVRELCTSSLIIHNGRLDFQGPVSEGISRYSRSVSDQDQEEAGRGTRWRMVEVTSRMDNYTRQMFGDEPLAVLATLELKSGFRSGRMILIVENAMGDTMVHYASMFEPSGGGLKAGVYQVNATFPPLHLAPGVYTLYLKMQGLNETGFMERHVSDRIAFEVEGSVQSLSRAVLAPSCEWEMKPLSACELTAEGARSSAPYRADGER
jgi:lipopolysaccharide transport system ATP-binding protein